MIGRKNLHVTAERANFPLGALNVRAGSAANVALFDVPVRAGVSVTAVWMRVTNCDGESDDFAAVQTGTLWVVDVPAAHFATPGEVSNGVEVWASGTGADSEPYTWNIGVGDLCVLDGDSGTPVPGVAWTAIKLRETAPTNPAYGDAKIESGALYVWDGTRWVGGGGGGGGIVDDTVTRASSNAVKSSGIWSAIWGTLAGLPTGFTALYDWCVAQLAARLSKSGGTMTGELVMSRGNAVVFGEASGPAVYTRNGTTLEADTRGTTGAVALLSDIPAVPTASTDTPLVDGTASAGSSAAYARGDHVHPTDTTRQASITASGILKGNGSGGVTAAVAGTDYQAPLSAYTSTPSAPTVSGSAGSSTEYARGDHVHPAETLVVTATLNLANMTVGNLSHTFSEILAARQAGRNVLLEAYAMTGADEGGRLLAWCSAEFGVVSGQSLQIGQLWFSAFIYTTIFDNGVAFVYYGAIRLDYDGTATLNLNRLAYQGDLDGKLSTTGDTRTVTATDSGGTETYKFAGTGDTDANTVVRVKELPYVNEGEAEEMLVDVYAISSRGVQRHTATSGETSATFGFADTPGTGKIADAILDIDNSGNSSDFALEFYGLGTDFALAVPDGDDLAEMTSVDGGKQARFYFTETALVSNNLPVISIQRITLGAVATAITRGS